MNRSARFADLMRIGWFHVRFEKMRACLTGGAAGHENGRPSRSWGSGSPRECCAWTLTATAARSWWWRSPYSYRVDQLGRRDRVDGDMDLTI